MSENSLDTPKVNEVGCRLVQPKEVIEKKGLKHFKPKRA
jgi:hypothetical protein